MQQKEKRLDLKSKNVAAASLQTNTQPFNLTPSLLWGGEVKITTPP